MRAAMPNRVTAWQAAKRLLNITDMHESCYADAHGGVASWCRALIVGNGGQPYGDGACDIPKITGA